MSLVVTCDGCEKVEQPIREDICYVTYLIDGEQYNKDFCAGCQDKVKTAILNILNIK